MKTTPWTIICGGCGKRENDVPGEDNEAVPIMPWRRFYFWSKRINKRSSAFACSDDCERAYRALYEGTTPPAGA